MLIALYSLTCLTLAAILLPLPLCSSFLYLTSRLFSNKQKIRRISRLRLLKHLVSILIFAPIVLLLGPIDFLLTVLYRCIKPYQPPVFICGTPRSGSTLLHRLLIQSSDELYGYTHLEWRFPSVTFQLLLSLTGFKKRLSQRNYWPESEIQNTVSKMHPNVMGDFEEDAILFEERIAHHPYQNLHSPESTTLNYFSLFSHEPTSFFSLRSRLMRIYKFCIYSLSILKYPSSTFVSKEVAANEKLWHLKDQFPKSKFIVITRHPDSYLSSLKPLLQLSTISKTGDDTFINSTTWWGSWYSWLVRQAQEVTHFYKKNSAEINPRVLHVSFESLVRNPHDEMKRIFNFLELPLTSKFMETIDNFQARQSSRARGYEYEFIDYSKEDFSEFLRVFYA